MPAIGPDALAQRSQTDQKCSLEGSDLRDTAKRATTTTARGRSTNPPYEKKKRSSSAAIAAASEGTTRAVEAIAQGSSLLTPAPSSEQLLALLVALEARSAGQRSLSQHAQRLQLDAAAAEKERGLNSSGRRRLSSSSADPRSNEQGSSSNQDRRRVQQGRRAIALLPRPATLPVPALLQGRSRVVGWRGDVETEGCSSTSDPKDAVGGGGRDGLYNAPGLPSGAVKERSSQRPASSSFRLTSQSPPPITPSKEVDFAYTRLGSSAPTPSRVASSFAAAQAHSKMGAMLQWFAGTVTNLFSEGLAATANFPQDWESELRRSKKELAPHLFELQGFGVLFSFIWTQLAAMDACGSAAMASYLPEDVGMDKSFPNGIDGDCCDEKDRRNEKQRRPSPLPTTLAVADTTATQEQEGVGEGEEQDTGTDAPSPSLRSPSSHGSDSFIDEPETFSSVGFLDVDPVAASAMASITSTVTAAQGQSAGLPAFSATHCFPPPPPPSNLPHPPPCSLNKAAAASIGAPPGIPAPAAEHRPLQGGLSSLPPPPPPLTALAMEQGDELPVGRLPSTEVLAAGNDTAATTVSLAETDHTHAHNADRSHPHSILPAQVERNSGGTLAVPVPAIPSATARAQFGLPEDDGNRRKSQPLFTHSSPKLPAISHAGKQGGKPVGTTNPASLPSVNGNSRTAATNEAVNTSLQVKKYGATAPSSTDTALHATEALSLNSTSPSRSPKRPRHGGGMGRLAVNSHALSHSGGGGVGGGGLPVEGLLPNSQRESRNPHGTDGPSVSLLVRGGVNALTARGNGTAAVPLPTTASPFRLDEIPPQQQQQQAQAIGRDAVDNGTSEERRARLAQRPVLRTVEDAAQAARAAELQRELGVREVRNYAGERNMQDYLKFVEEANALMNSSASEEEETREEEDNERL